MSTPFFLSLFSLTLRAPAPRMGAPGYWHARRDALVRELTRRELELEELEARESAVMPMLAAAAESREKTSYAMGLAAEARAAQVRRDELRCAEMSRDEPR
mmetsp:Transcript_33438/g.105159  ORF Transcript_33438/g.105159 Transcript_33438/m.105159 type:complete len:101 (-) Transcript_33438:538-840(-)